MKLPISLSRFISSSLSVTKTDVNNIGWKSPRRFNFSGSCDNVALNNNFCAGTSLFKN